MPSADQIREVCQRNKTNSFYVEPIPALQLANARAALCIPSDEIVIGLIDLTVFGSCKDALAICPRALYWKNISESPDSISWDDFSQVTLEITKSFLTSKIEFGKLKSWSVAGGPPPATTLRILTDLQAITAPANTLAWTVAINQRQFGPYDTESLKSLVANGQIDATSALVWRDGMANWSPYNDVDELKALPNRRSVAPPIPRPPSAAPPIVASEPVLAETVEPPFIAKQSAIAEARPMVDLNNAPLDDLLYLPGLTLASAKQLMQERQSRLGFQTIEEVGELLDLPPHRVQRLRERVRIEPFAGTGHATSARRRVVDF